MKENLRSVSCVSFNFPGFYHSVFVNDTAFDTSAFPSIITDFFNKNDLYDYVLMEDYQKEIAENWLSALLPKGIYFKNVGIISPAYYNFETDKVKYEAVLNKPFEEIVEEVKNHPFFAEFLKRNFTSYDGFFSFYPNTVEEFISNMFERDTPTEIEAGAIIYVYSLIKYAEGNEWDNVDYEETEQDILEYAEEYVVSDRGVYEESYFDMDKFEKDLSALCNIKGKLTTFYELEFTEYDKQTNTLTVKV